MGAKGDIGDTGVLRDPLRRCGINPVRYVLDSGLIAVKIRQFLLLVLPYEGFMVHTPISQAIDLIKLRLKIF